MFHQLQRNDYGKVTKLVVNTNHELCIEAVIKGKSPGEIYVDDTEKPHSALIITPECKVVAGYAGNPKFNAGVKQRLDFYEDSVLCDTEEWENQIHEIHSNIAVRKYTRRYYQLNQILHSNVVDLLHDKYTVEYVYADKLDGLHYENAEKVTNWFQFTNIDDFKGYCLGAYVRTDSKIVSWCLADCIVADKMEIGINTDPEFRRQGLGTIAAAATVSKCISNGISQIGWHCVDSNIGSYTVAERVGFVKAKEYSCYTPYPPIENISDLNYDEWAEWGRHYDAMNQIEPRYHWQAAQCWALANNVSNTVTNVKHLWNSGQIKDCDLWVKQLSGLQDNERWRSFIETLVCALTGASV